MPDYLICNDCGWTGEHDELVDDNNDGRFDQCPRCGSQKLMKTARKINIWPIV